MISQMLALLAAGTAAQGPATDTTRSAREAYTSCLRSYMNRSAEARTPPAEFEAGIPRECGTQEAAFRQAIIRRDTAARVARASAEESANLEVEDAKVNFVERYQMTMEPQ